MDGWNVVGKQTCEKIEPEWGFSGYNFTQPVKDTIDGKPVTSMCSTYYYGNVNQDLCYIPSTVKYMLFTYKHTNFENVEMIELPAEYVCETFRGATGIKKVEFTENLKGFGYSVFVDCKTLEGVEGIPEAIIKMHEKWREMEYGQNN